MMSPGEKVVALLTIVAMNFAIFLFSTIFGLIAVVASAPLAIAILKR